MDFENVDEILSNLSSSEKEQFKNIFSLLNEIKTNSSAKPNSYIHLLLREKYFILIQAIIETPNSLLVKLVFNCLQRFIVNESTCELCAIKEKSQFLLNILRYIQHTHINEEIIKLEVFKLLLNNYETIQQILNSKVLTSLLEIAINEYESPTNLVQSTSKAIIIKYISIVCNQISTYKNSNIKNDDIEPEIESFDSYIVGVFTALLNKFNQEYKSHELRSLILECMELLLNNLLAEDWINDNHNSYNIRKNSFFIKFAWQQFCPSILFQFGDCGLPSKELAPQSINFKQIYTILIQLTGLIGGCKSMISVFEAIYQRILFYTPELDRNLILKLFKNYLNEKFIISLVFVENENTEKNSKTTMPDTHDFTLINLIIGFYRNCYEKSIKPTENKLVQLLSCECIQSFIDILYTLFDKFETTQIDYNNNELVLNKSVIGKKIVKKLVETKNLDSETSKLIEQEASNFYRKFSQWLVELITNKCNDTNFNIDLEIKKFCLSFINSSDSDCEDDFRNRQLGLNSAKLYVTTYFSLYKIFKSSTLLNQTINLTNFKYEKKNQSHKEYFIYRILIYSEVEDLTQKNNEFKIYFKYWLSYIFDYLNDFSEKKSEIASFLSSYDNFNIKLNLKLQLNFILKQMDCLTKIHLKTDNKFLRKPECDTLANNTHSDIIKNLLRSSWPYLTDVLVGFMLNTNLSSIENIIFNKSKNPATDVSDQDQKLSSNDLINNNSLTDLSLVLFAHKACIDSLHQLIKMVAFLDSMDKELNQLFLLLISNPFRECLGIDNLNNEITLNQIICLDFVLNVTLSLVCDLDTLGENSLKEKSQYIKYRNLQIKNNPSFEILWKFLIETMFFCFYLQTNMNDEMKQQANLLTIEQNELDYNNNNILNSLDIDKKEINSISKYLMTKNKVRNSSFRSVYSNLNELAYNQEDHIVSTSKEFSSLPHSNTIDGASSIEHHLTSSKFLNQQRKLIYKDLFLFLNKKINFVDLDKEIKTINKVELINLISKNIYDHLFIQLFVHADEYLILKSSEDINNKRFHLDLFDIIWQFISNLCKYSRRYLLKEISIRNQHEYFTFNNLIIDKIEELFLKLVDKLTINNNLDSKLIETNFNLDVSSLLMPASSNSNQLPKTTYSIYSIFINDIWLNVFLSYFMTLCSHCGLDKKTSKKKCNSLNNDVSKSASLPQYLINKARLKASSFRSNKLNGKKKLSSANNNDASKNKKTDLFLIDFTICKKLINLIQKVFEIYNSTTSNINLMKIASNKNRFENKLKDFGLIQTPSNSSNVSTPTQIENDVDISNNNLILNNEFILRLEKSKKNLVNSQSPNERISSQLLHLATTSMIMPSSVPTIEQIEIFLIDEYLNFNTLFLLPFRCLMLKKYLDGHLKDAIISSICELVESSSYKIKNSWNCLFTCVSNVDLNSHLNKSKNKKGLSNLLTRRKKRKFFNLRRSKIQSNNEHTSRIKSGDSDVSSDFAKSFESFTSHITSDQSFNTSSRSNSSDNITISTFSSSESTYSSLSKESLSPVISRSMSKTGSINSNINHQTESISITAANISNDESVKSTDSSSRSQSPSSITTLSFTNLSFKFDSYRIRLNSLIDIFNIYLSISSNSNYILENGTFEFIKCITNYLQYSSHVNMNKLKIDQDLFDLEFNGNLDEEKKTEHEEPIDRNDNNNDLNKKDENDVYLSHNNFYQITSNYEYLCELSSSNNSNTLIKPFLVCIEKLFNILIKKLDYFSNERFDNDQLSNNTDNMRSLINKKIFKLNDYELCRISHLNQFCYDWLSTNILYDYELNQNNHDKFDQLFKIENKDEFDELNKQFIDYLSQNDSKNIFKLFSYLIESLTSRIFLSFDELNCVQLVEFTFNLLSKLINIKQYVLVAYCILEILLKYVNKIIDLIEFKQHNQTCKNKNKMSINAKHLINKKIYDNTFFVSNLIKKLIDKTIDATSRLAYSIYNNKSKETLIYSFLNCIQSRIAYLLSKSLIRKIKKFESIIDLSFMDSKNLNKYFNNLFRLNDSSLNLKCLNSIKLYHFLSSLQFDRILRNYYKNEQNNKDVGSLKSSLPNFEVLTKKCQNSWQLHNLKMTYNTAKNLLYYEPFSTISLNEIDTSKSMTNQDSENEDLTKPVMNEMTLNREDIDCEDEDDYQFNNSIDDKNFYRDFTIEFNQGYHLVEHDDYTKKKNKFLNIKNDSQDNCEIEINQVNLTSFIILTRFHFDLIRLIKNICSKNQFNNEFIFELLICLNKTYLSSLKLDHLLSFKILLSKIFYLNCENSLANFINLTSESYLAINDILFKNHLKKLDLKFIFNEKFFQDDLFMVIDDRRINEMNQISEQSNDKNFKLLELLENKIETFLNVDSNNNELDTKLNEYFFYFIQHLNTYYFDLNEKSHDFKLQRTYLIKTIRGDKIVQHESEEDKSIIEKRDDQIDKTNDEDDRNKEIINRKVLELFRLHKQQNKALTMFNLTKKTELNVKLKSNDDNEDSLDKLDNNQNNTNTINQSQEAIYFQRDCRFRYQIWSNEIISNFLLNMNHLNKKDDELTINNMHKLIDLYSFQDLNGDNRLNKCLLNCLAELIVVFNSCSSYCQCSVIVESNASLELSKINDISAKLLSFLIQKLNEN